PRGNLARSRMLAPATTGPASGAHPASSTPASGCGNSMSSLKEQRRGIESSCVPLRRQGSRHVVWLSTEKTGLLSSQEAESAFHSPRREAAAFGGFLEKDDVTVRIAQARLAPYPGMVARTMLEGDSAAGERLHSPVE